MRARVRGSRQTRLGAPPRRTASATSSRSARSSVPVAVSASMRASTDAPSASSSAAGPVVAAVTRMRPNAAVAVMAPKVIATASFPAIDAAMIPGMPAAATTRSTVRSASALTPRSPLHERLVPDPVRLVGLGAEATVPVDLVVAEVAFEPPDLGVALEREDVGGDPVEEPPVVGDDHGAAREREERV